jgi:tetratricopeptide (TPR) repeat protein
MERSKCWVIAVLLLGNSMIGFADYKSEVYKAFSENNMLIWKNVITELNAVKNKDNELLLDLVNYQYGYIAWCLGNKDENEAEKILNQAEKNIEILEKRNHKLSILYAYKAAFYGYRIGLNAWVAPVAGLKSLEYAKLAVKVDANNSLGFIQNGNIEFYMPPIFGGSKTSALKYFIEAQKLMEKNPSDIKYNWNYLSLLTIIAQAYSDIHDYKSACTYYEKILKIEPNYIWVKNELYPKAKKKINL